MLFARLWAGREAIEESILARAYSVSDPAGSGDPEYVAGLRAAVSAAVDYGLSALDADVRGKSPIPTALLAQARHAARRRVSLDTVLCRYFAGYTLLADFILEEAESGRLVEGPELQRMLRAVAAVFDELVVAVTEEYTREAEQHSPSPERRRTECAQSLLAGELVDHGDLGYELGCWHLGLVAAAGGEAEDALRGLARALDRQLLLVRPDRRTIWAWLGGRGKLLAGEARIMVASKWAGGKLAIGEPAEGPGGWRLTHRQASAALFAAHRSSESIVGYADVALLASMLQDEVLSASLERLFLAPLREDRDGGESLRLTLRAYFAAQRNVSSAAAALGVTRKTISSRLRSIEERLGRPIESCAAELEAALKLDSCAGVANGLPI